MPKATKIHPAPSYLNEPQYHPGIPVEVQFRHMPDSKRVIRLVNQMMERFDKYHLSGARCTVMVDETHHRHGKSIFQVKARLSVPGKPLYLAQSLEKTGKHDGIYSALGNVIDSLDRQLAKTHDLRARHRVHTAYEDAA